MCQVIMRIGKENNYKEMNNRYLHDMRIFDVINADPLRSSQNQILADEMHGSSYDETAKATIRHFQLNGAISRKLRSNAVFGLDLILTFSHEATEWLDLEEWKRLSLKWLNETFNPPDRIVHFTDPTGKKITEEVQNVKFVLLHMDESTPHIHAFIVPIDSKGHLNARAYINGRDTLIHLQDTYAEAVKSTGLKRGARHTVTRHKQQSRYYNNIQKPVEAELPPPLPGEEIEEYHKRVNTVYQIEMCHHQNDLIKLKREIAQSHEQRFEQYAKELSSRRMEIEKELLALDHGKAELDDYSTILKDSLGVSELTEDSLLEIRSVLEEKKLLEKAFCAYPDQTRVSELQDSIQEILHWELDREGKKKDSLFIEIPSP